MNDEEKIQFGRDLYNASYAGAAQAANERQDLQSRGEVQSPPSKGLVRSMHIAIAMGEDGLERIILTPNSLDARVEIIRKHWERLWEMEG